MMWARYPAGEPSEPVNGLIQISRLAIPVLPVSGRTTFLRSSKSTLVSNRTGAPDSRAFLASGWRAGLSKMSNPLNCSGEEMPKISMQEGFTSDGLPSRS